MNIFGRLNARVSALAQTTLGGIIGRTGKLDEWTPDTPPERTDYEALWQEVTAPIHPVIDARIRMRTVDQNAGDRYGCREQEVIGPLELLAREARTAIAVEALKRFVFLDYCVYWSFNRGNDVLAACNNFGISRDALVALEGDFETLARHLLARGQLRFDPELLSAFARLMAFAGEPVIGPTGSTMRSFVYLAQPLLCTPETAADDRKKLALLRLFNALGESSPLRTHRDATTESFIEAIAATIGVAPETNPVIKAKHAALAQAEEERQAVIKVAGPHLKSLVETAYRDGAAGQFRATSLKQKGEAAGLDALTPAARAEALFACIRLFNFTNQTGHQSGRRSWPADAKLTGFRAEDFPPPTGSSSSRHCPISLTELFLHLGKRKLELTEDMQCELLLLMRSNLAVGMMHSLLTVKIIEGNAKGNASPRLRRELQATVDWLRGATDHYALTFKKAALYRLEKALKSLAPAATAPGNVTPLPDSGTTGQGFGLRLPGGFGRRAAPPEAAVVIGMPASALAANGAAPLPPPRKPGADGKPVSLVDYYGDLSDVRKCSVEHIAFLDEQIAIEASDIEAEARRRFNSNPMLSRLSEEQQANALAHARTQVVRDRERYRALMEMMKRRVQAIASLGESMRAVWPAFHDHARALYGKSKPAAAWQKQAKEILAPVSADDQIAALRSVTGIYPCSTAHFPTDDVVRGLIYTAVRLPADKVGTAIADFARQECFQTVPGVGIRDKRMGNACLWTLINMPEGAGVPYLARLLNRVKYPSVKKVINAALDEAASKAGMSRGTLDELSVPTHDLADGRREIALGEAGAAAILEIAGTADVAVSYRRADGKATASVPAELKEFKAEIKEAKNTAKEIEADLATQIGRLQRIWLENRDWSFADWQARYAEHPLLAQLTRRLIWEVTTEAGRTSATLVDRVLEDVSGKAVSAESARISLWHPIGRPIEEVLAWRQRLQDLGIVQPFKQAHREVYYVTDAERTTDIYSNRFAGHILRQHQMMTLARLNNWNVTHRINADVPNDEPTHLVIPAWNIVAELWTWGAGGDDPEVSDSQAYLYVSTNQVRFYRIAGDAAVRNAFGPARGEAMRMQDVPPIVFSEVMRHCDLFTSVASVANDPNWVDGGADAQHPSQWRQNEGRTYWHEAALGPLNQSAASRKEVIEALLPSLKIAKNCEIDGNFLRVKGKLRSYRIHFGSGNIMIEPDNRYLCIVPNSVKEPKRIMLPFEGDTMLSIILSKAMLMVDDDKINDLVIVRQIYR